MGSMGSVGSMGSMGGRNSRLRGSTYPRNLPYLGRSYSRWFFQQGSMDPGWFYGLTIDKKGEGIFPHMCWP